LRTTAESGEIGELLRPEDIKSLRSKVQPIALRVELRDVDPLVWRRIIVPNVWTVSDLHDYVQWVMGWSDTHAHEFQVGNRVIAPGSWLDEIDIENETANYCDERRVTVGALAAEAIALGEIEYRYDMGDGWRHRIVAEPVPAAWLEFELPLPVCTAGAHACPPEDVGGPHGYDSFRDAVSNPEHDEHGDLLRWIGGAFDPLGFDINRINRDWRGMNRPRAL
jgi:Plasmid pRiA4b ORF-3-like protein